MANSFQTHTGDGTTVTFSWSQIDGYLSASHIYVYVNGLVKTVSTQYTINTTARTVTFTAGNIPESQAYIKIQRITPKTVAGLQVTYTDASVLTATDMNNAQKQQLFITQEAQDTGSGALGLNDDGDAWDAQVKRVSNSAAPLELNDLVTKGYVDSIALYGAYTVPQNWAFSGTGAKTDYDLVSPSPTSVNAQMFLVEVNGVLQRPVTNYDIVQAGAGYQLQFTAAPASGSNNIVVRNFGVSRSALDVLPNGSVTNAYLATDAVATVNLQDLSVTTAKLAEPSVTTPKITDLAVTTAKIADLNVTTGKIAASAIDSTRIANGAVTTDKLQDLAVTNAKIGNGQVDGGKIAQNAVAYDQLKATGFAPAGDGSYRMIHTDSSGDLGITKFGDILGQFTLNALLAPTSALAMGSQKITGLGAPSANTDAATKAYVDSVSAGGAIAIGQCSAVAQNNAPTVTDTSGNPSTIFDGIVNTGVNAYGIGIRPKAGQGTWAIKMTGLGTIGSNSTYQSGFLASCSSSTGTNVAALLNLTSTLGKSFSAVTFTAVRIA